MHRSTRTSLSALGLTVVLGSCIPVPVHYTPPADTEQLAISGDAVGHIVVAPFFHRARVNEFITTLREIDGEIETVSADTVFEYAFPASKQIREVPLRDLLAHSVREQIVERAGVSHIVVIGALSTQQKDGEGRFTGISMSASQTLSAQIQALLLDLQHPDTKQHLRTKAEGEDSAAWYMLPYIGVFVFGSVPDTTQSVIDGLADSVARELGSRKGEGQVKLMVIAGEWEAMPDDDSK
jgi:hypothetical protein